MKDYFPLMKLPNQVTLRLLFYILCTAFVALGVVFYFPSSQSHWLVMSALVGTLISQLFIAKHKILFLLLVALLAAIAACVPSLINNHLIILTLFLFAITFLTSFFGLRYPNSWPAMVVINFYAIYACSLVIHFAVETERFFYIIVGFGSAFIIYALFFRGRIVIDSKKALAECIRSLSDLAQTIFSVYITHDYVNIKFIYEKNLHADSDIFLYEIQRARQLIQKLDNHLAKNFLLALDKIEQIYELLLTLGLLVHRVADHSTFSVAEKELTAITASVVAYLQVLVNMLLTKNYSSAKVSSLSDDIFSLEEINQSALQVVAQEPIVFFIFIQDLRALNEILLQLSATITSIEGVST
jgi:uncharacterized membrane protein YccC